MGGGIEHLTVLIIIILAQVLNDIQRLHPRCRLTEREKKFVQYYTKRYAVCENQGKMGGCGCWFMTMRGGGGGREGW